MLTSKLMLVILVMTLCSVMSNPLNKKNGKQNEKAMGMNLKKSSPGETVVQNDLENKDKEEKKTEMDQSKTDSKDLEKTKKNIKVSLVIDQRDKLREKFGIQSPPVFDMADIKNKLKLGTMGDSKDSNIMEKIKKAQKTLKEQNIPVSSSDTKMPLVQQGGSGFPDVQGLLKKIPFQSGSEVENAMKGSKDLMKGFSSFPFSNMGGSKSGSKSLSIDFPFKKPDGLKPLSNIGDSKSETRIGSDDERQAVFSMPNLQSEFAKKAGKSVNIGMNMQPLPSVGGTELGTKSLIPTSDTSKKSFLESGAKVLPASNIKDGPVNNVKVGTSAIIDNMKAGKSEERLKQDEKKEEKPKSMLQNVSSMGGNDPSVDIDAE